MSDDNMTTYLRQRYGLTNQTREELIKLIHKEFPWMIGTVIR